MAQMTPYSKLQQKDLIRVQLFQRESLSMIIQRLLTVKERFLMDFCNKIL